MDKLNSPKKEILIGAISGIILFAIVGLLPSSFIGGVIGLKIAGYFVGMPIGKELLSRSIVGISMVVGITITGLIFVMFTSFIGWLVGHLSMSYKGTTMPKAT